MEFDSLSMNDKKM